MRMLSPLDATFIYLESEHSPMAIGGVYIIDAADAPADFSYESWHALVKSRLRFSRVFRERLVEVPWDLSFPYWVRDPDFDLDDHLPRMTLPAPGGMTELMQMAAQTWGRMLDRKKPLWEITFVEGLDKIHGISKGSFALITKVHHAAVDGQAGNEMMSALFDMANVVRDVGDKDTWEPEELPSTVGVIKRSWSKAGSKLLDMASFVGKVAASTVDLRTGERLHRIEPPPSLLSAPATIFNQPLDSPRTFWGKNFDFERLRNIRKKVPAATINDVVLAICAGGLRGYLSEKGELPANPLVAMAPISMRGKQHDSDPDTGNQVSAMLVSLATDIGDAANRLVHIHANTQRSKIQASALPANKLTGFLPSEMLAAAARLYTRTRLGGHHRPFYNVTITNVPGPPEALYVAGAPIHSAFGMAPILDGLGLILVIFSYHGRLSIGITSCEQVVPDPDVLAEWFGRSLEELEKALSLATPAMLTAVHQLGETEPVDRSASLHAFRDASEALDRAIKALEDKET